MFHTLDFVLQHEILLNLYQTVEKQSIRLQPEKQSKLKLKLYHTRKEPSDHHLSRRYEDRSLGAQMTNV